MVKKAAKRLLPWVKTPRRSFYTVLIVSMIIGCLFLYLGALNIASRSTGVRSIFDNVKDCEAIIPNISMSQSYEQAQVEFLASVKNITDKYPSYEGHYAGFEGETKMLHYFAGLKRVKIACETGFNLGHNSFNYLTANDQLIVHSFDLGEHGYAHEMSEYMKKKFPGKFFIHFGGSVELIPKFIEVNPDVKCDFMFIDGGHDYPATLADVKNFARMANLEGNLIMFNGHPADGSQGFGEAWDEMAMAGVIEEKTRCTFFHASGRQRGFSIGRAMKRPK